MPHVLPGETGVVSKTALIVVDMLNAYDHEDAEPLTRSVESTLPALRRLLDQDLLTIYVNDNFGSWTSNRDDLIERALAGPYAHLVDPIVPRDGALFVVKARHSIFYGTPLEYLLGQEDIDRLVLAGQVTEQCILYSALDAYIRHFEVHVPRDAVAHIHSDLADAALKMMRINMRADVSPVCDRG
jgi:nicotinamidase-related amidase